VGVAPNVAHDGLGMIHHKDGDIYVELIVIDDGEIHWYQGIAMGGAITDSDLKYFPYSDITDNPAVESYVEFTVSVAGVEDIQTWRVGYNSAYQQFDVDVIQADLKTSFSLSTKRRAILRCDGDRTKGLG
jgi:hypothetical protein